VLVVVKCVSVTRQVACNDIQTDLNCSCTSALRQKHTHTHTHTPIKREQFYIRYAKIPEKEPRRCFLQGAALEDI